MPKEIFSLVVPKRTPRPLTSANKTIKVPVPCKRRAKLFRAELVTAQQAIRDLTDSNLALAPGGPRVRKRFWYALTGERLVDLLASLAEILDDYVAYGVQEDFRPGNLGAAEQDYNAYFSHQIDAGPGVGGFYTRYPLLSNAVNTLTRYFVDNIRTALDRLINDWAEIERGFLNPPADTLHSLYRIEPTGSDFHKRGKQVLILTFAYTTANPPALALWRRRAARSNRKAITRRTATAGTANALNMRPYLLKVVYKPSDVEIDCRIMGDTQRLAAARGGVVGPENPAIAQSLMELLNQRLGRAAGAADELPTYLIIPHNPGSAIGVNPPGAAMGNSYGYIEFLTHEPRASRGDEAYLNAHRNYNGFTDDPRAATQIQTACNRIPNWRALDCMDWVTGTHPASQEVFRHWGRLAAIAIVFSIADMHVQNVIIHKNKPHLIDLEDSIKWRMTAIGQTGFFGAGTPSCDNFAGPNPLANAKANDRQKNLMCGPLPGPQSFSATVLFEYLAGGAPQRQIKANMQAELHAGFNEIFNLMANPADNAALDNWANTNLPNVITRFVAMPTGDYYNALFRFISANLTRNPPLTRAVIAADVAAGPPYRPPAADAVANGGGAAAITTAYQDQFRHFGNWYFESRINAERQTWRGIVRNAGEAEETRQWRTGYLPIFALEHPECNWLDIVQWDIPSFYRRLNTTDLLNSDGEAIDPGAAIDWQNDSLIASGANGLLVGDFNQPTYDAAQLAAIGAAGGAGGVINVANQATHAANAVNASPAANAAAVAAAAAGQPIYQAAQAASGAPGATVTTVAEAAARVAERIETAVLLRNRYFSNQDAAQQAAIAAAGGAGGVINVANQATHAANAVTASPGALAAAQAGAGAGQPIHLAAQAASVAHGATVTTVAQAAADAAATAASPVRLQHFFPEAALDVVRRQITNLRDNPPGTRSAYWTALQAACIAAMP